MKKATLFLLFFAVLATCEAQSNLSDFDLGIKRNKFCNSCNKSIRKNILIAIDRSTILKGFECIRQNILFTIAIDSRKRIVYYSTKDSNFLINSFQYLTRKKNIIDSLRMLPLIYDPTWGAYIELPDQWNLGYDISDIEEGSAMKSLKNGAIPQYLFKRSKSYRAQSKWVNKYNAKPVSN